MGDAGRVQEVWRCMCIKSKVEISVGFPGFRGAYLLIPAGLFIYFPRCDFQEMKKTFN